ncbi:glutamine synthetase family protein [Nocardia arthritidis]|nr:glutamine synthetase family protein [Nocardia arthritidis]
MSVQIPRYSIDQLRRDIIAGSVEEVVLALPVLHGDPKGQRIAADHFLTEVIDNGLGACVYLLAADIDMRTGPGYAIDVAGAGFGDFVLRPDLATVRRLPWDDATAYVLADATWRDGTVVPVAPRRILRDQLDRLAGMGLRAFAGTELEFLVFRDSYQDAHDHGYRELRPATRYNADYALTGLDGVTPLVRDITRAMTAAGMRVETARAECHPGQYEIVFRYDDPLTTCDNHVLYKVGAKQLAAQRGAALTFMAKYDAGEGNSCHVHLSLRAEDGAAVFADPDRDGGMSRLMDHFVAGQLACMADLMLLFAPNVNSYKRLQPGSFAPVTCSWGRDDRTAPVRVLGAGHSLRLEHRVPGGDANPYLAVAAMIAAGLYGIEHELELPPPSEGGERLPSTLRAALDRWESSPVAHTLFGDDIVAHYANSARLELATFDAAVTDWERVRGFERN